MHVAYSQPRPGRSTTWKITVAALGALLVLVVGGLAVAAFTPDAPPAEAATTGAGAGIATFSLGTVSGAPLMPVDAPLRLAGADGLASASLRLTYDPDVVTLTGVRPGNAPQGALTWHHAEAEGALVLLLTTSLADGLQGDADVAVLTFEAREGAVGEVSPLALELRGGVRADGTVAALDVATGSFRNGVRGDVLGDGVVDRADYDALARYLVGEPVSIILLNADLDGDGEATTADAVRLHQYLDGARDAP